MYEVLVFDVEKNPVEVVKYTIEKYVGNERKEGVPAPMEDMKNLAEKLERFLNRVDDSKKAAQRFVVLPCRGRDIVVREEEIYYIERRGRETLVHLKKETLVTTVKLGDMGAYLQSEYFVRCHNSFVVNLKRVFSYERTEFILRNREHVPISRSRVGEVKDAFKQLTMPGEDGDW